MSGHKLLDTTTTARQVHTQYRSEGNVQFMAVIDLNGRLLIPPRDPRGE